MSTTEIHGDADPRRPPPAPSRAPQREAEPAAPPARPPWYRRPLVLGALAIVALAVIVGAVVWWLHARRYESTDDAFIDAHMVQVGPQVAGRVLRVAVSDNQDVAAGQLLIELDPADFQARLEQAVAAKAAAEGSVAQAKAQQAAAQANLEQARADVGVAEANAENAALQLQRDRQLDVGRVISRQQLDNDMAAAKSTAAARESARKRTAASAAQLGVAASAVATAEANLKAAEAQVAQARLNLSYTKIAAPEDGSVTHLSVAVGDYLQVGQNIMSLVPFAVWVTANFKETQLDRMRPGDPASIAVDAYPEAKFHGHVDSIQSGSGAAFSLLPPENATGNYVKVVQRVPVKIVFDGAIDRRYRLGPGMSVVPTVKVR